MSYLRPTGCNCLCHGLDGAEGDGDPCELCQEFHDAVDAPEVDRDEVRKLAEEIQRAYERDLPVKSFELTDLTEWLVPTLTTLLAQRESALQAQLHRALGELGQLRGALQEIIKDAPEEGFQPTREWTGNADDTFEEGSKMSHAWCADIARTALSASPLSERAGAVLKSVGWLIEHQPENGFFFGPAEQSEHQARQEKLADDWYDLRAELQKGGDDA